MNFLKRLFSGTARGWQDETAEAVFIYTQCEACQETFRSRIDKHYDLMTNYDEGGPAYRVHKELVGSHCRKRVTLDLEFDQQKRLTAKAIQHGRLLSREEFEALQPEPPR